MESYFEGLFQGTSSHVTNLTDICRRDARDVVRIWHDFDLRGTGDGREQSRAAAASGGYVRMAGAAGEKGRTERGRQRISPPGPRCSPLSVLTALRPHCSTSSTLSAAAHCPLQAARKESCEEGEQLGRRAESGERP